MWFNLTFRKWPQDRQLEHVRAKGVSLGSRLKEGRSVFVYMVRNLFVQIVFKNDQEWKEVENLTVFNSLEKLNSYLEEDFRLAFNTVH